MMNMPTVRLGVPCAVVACLLVLGPGLARAQGEQKIEVLVNDLPISAYDISQRLRFMAVSTRQKPTAQLRKQVIETLINETLQLHEAKKAGIVIAPDLIMRHLDNIGKRNNMNGKQLLKAFASMGVQSKTVKQRIRVSLAWRRYIQRKFRGQVTIGATQIDKALSGEQSEGTERTEFQLRRVRLDLPKRPDQKTIAARLIEAERLRSGFKSCQTISDTLKDVRKASVRDVGRKALDHVPQPVRSYLKKTSAGQMTPPSVTSAGIEFYAVCGRRAVKSNARQRQQVQYKLAEQEYQIRARRHLRDIRQDAFIEYR